MPHIVEGTHTGEFILSEGPGTLSRETVTVIVPAATTLPAGTVLAEGESGYAPITSGIATETLAILYAPLTNDDDESASMDGVVIDAIAEVRGADLDWNSQSAVVQATAIALLRSQGVKVRDYTPTGS